jgi:hypothetical protein
MAPRLLTNEEAGFTEEQLKKIATATEYKDKGDAAFKTGDAKTGRSLLRRVYLILNSDEIFRSTAALSLCTIYAAIIHLHN